MTTWNLTLSDNPQDVINYASAGDTLIFPSGTYSNMVPRYYGALLYSPKPLVFDMSAGTTLQAATGQTSLLSVPEIAVGKYAAFTGLNDMTASFITPLDPLNYNNVSSVVITIDGSRGGQPLTSVPYEEAIKHKDIVYEEHDICDLSGKGGSCGI